MAKVRVQNRTTSQLVVPRPLNFRLKQGEAKEIEIIEVDKTFNDPRISELVDKGYLKLTLLEDDTPDTGATLPFYSTAQLPVAGDNAGMMVYNTTDEQVQVSDGTVWLGVSVLLIISGSLPAPTSVPAGYAVFSKDDQAIYVNGGSAWMLTQANGITDRPSHQFPVASSVPVGTMIFDSDNQQLKLSDGARWQLTNNVTDYSTISNLPAVTEIGFGGLILTSREGTLWARVGANFIPCTGSLRYYATYGDLPTNVTWGSNETGAIAYIDDDRCIVVWDGKYWRYPTQLRDYKPVDIPSASNYSDGHMILNGDCFQPLIAWSGSWKGITPVAQPFAAASRPANADCEEGTMIWNTTSNKANFNIGGSWLDALGVVDP